MTTAHARYVAPAPDERCCGWHDQRFPAARATRKVECSACHWSRAMCRGHDDCMTFSRGVRQDYSALDKAFAGHANVHRPAKLRAASRREIARKVSRTAKRKAEERRLRAAWGRA